MPPSVGVAVELVPPLAIGKIPVKEILPSADNAILPVAETATVPFASGNVYNLSAVAAAPSNVFTKVFAEPLHENLLLALLKKTVPAPIAAGVEDWVAKLIKPFPPVPVMPREVALATPKIGVTKVGEVENTDEPVPVSSDKTVASCADVVAANALKSLDVVVSVPDVGKVTVPLPATAFAFKVVVPLVLPAKINFVELKVLAPEKVSIPAGME
jgi:hypothetical protein